MCAVPCRREVAPESIQPRSWGKSISWLRPCIKSAASLNVRQLKLGHLHFLGHLRFGVFCLWNTPFALTLSARPPIGSRSRRLHRGADSYARALCTGGLGRSAGAASLQYQTSVERPERYRRDGALLRNPSTSALRHPANWRPTGYPIDMTALMQRRSALHARLNSRMISCRGVNAWSAVRNRHLLPDRHHGWGPANLAIVPLLISVGSLVPFRKSPQRDLAHIVNAALA
jgi:hypothetical protein